MATQIEFQASPPMQENPSHAKKRKRNNASDDMSPPKRGNLQEVNGNGLTSNESSLPVASPFPDSENASNFPPHPQPQHDEASTNMLAALHAQGHLPNYGGATVEQGGFEMGSPGQVAPQPYMQHYGPSDPAGQAGLGTDSPGLRKPEVGTEEWHKVRRDNHKEVERRRRETINEGINELAKIVPGNEKNKGSILSRTVTEIRELRARVEEYERQGALSHNVLEQAVRELSSANESLKRNIGLVEQERDDLRSTNARLVQKVRDLGGAVEELDDLAKFEG